MNTIVQIMLWILIGMLITLYVQGNNSMYEKAICGDVVVYYQKGRVLRLDNCTKEKKNE